MRKGNQGGKPSRPSKFTPGKITHLGYVSDHGGRILPWWPNPADHNSPDPNKMEYKQVKPDLKPPSGHILKPGEGVEGPPGPPVWESLETIKALYKMLDTVGCKLQISAIQSDKTKDAKSRKQQHDGR